MAVEQQLLSKASPLVRLLDTRSKDCQRVALIVTAPPHIHHECFIAPQAGSLRPVESRGVALLPNMDRDMLKDRLTGKNGVNAPITLDRVSDALENKRRQLNEQVEEFKTQKKEEYLEYERQLRCIYADEDSGGHQLQGRKLDNEDDIKRKASHQPRNNSARQAARRSRTARETLSQAFGGFPGPPNTGSKHSHDKDFEGLFTPEYLGWINGDNLRPHRQLLTDAKTGAGVQLSSSDTSNPANPPIAPPSLSSSAPTDSPTITHRRSDSSNSLLSVSSLRSSMKDPNTPKSSKRVLFSIEDGVVSPSTSPTISRKSTAEQGGFAGEENEVLDSIFDLGRKAKRKKNRRKDRGGEDIRGRQIARKELEDLGTSEGRGYTNFADGWSRSIPTPRGLDISANKPASLRSLDNVVDGFEKVEIGDEDDVFVFDEDLDVQKEEKSDQAPSKDLDDVEETAKESLTGSSPHAGSLPIEIKWPGRRDTDD